jgi:hypothetical protein
LRDDPLVCPLRADLRRLPPPSLWARRSTACATTAAPWRLARERVGVRPGDHVRLGVDSAHLHLFRTDSGERLQRVH